MTKLILMLSVVWIPILIYFMNRNETKFKKNLVLEVTLPYAARSDEAVLAVLKRFLKQLGWITLVLLLAIIPSLRIEGAANLMTYLFTWLVFVIIAPIIPYVRANQQLKQLKRARGWQRSPAEPIRVDSRLIGRTAGVSDAWFISPVVISLGMILLDWPQWPLYLIFFATQVFFWLSHRFLYRNRLEMVDDNPSLTQALSQVRKYNWGLVWIISSYSLLAMMLLAYLASYQPTWYLIGFLVVVLIMTVLVIRVEFKVRRVQEKLTAQSGQDWYVDEDDHWIGGMVYYNPDDSRLLINQRVGLNTTFNLAHPAGKILTGLLVLVILAMPFTGVFIQSLEAKPIRLEANTETVVAWLGQKSTVLDLNDIQSVTKLDQLPNNLTRTMGNGLDHQLSGRFTAPAYGALRLILDPTKPPFLLIETNDTKYLWASRDPVETQQVYQTILKALERKQP